MLFGKTQQIGTVARIRAAVIDRFKTAILSMYQPERIIQLFAAVEFAALQLLGDHRGAAHSGIVEVLIPVRQILNGGEEAGGANGIEICHAQPEHISTLALLVAIGNMFHDLSMVVAEMRVLHAERFENTAARKSPE